ncbi:hypothetical protein [Cohnella kolymensis]|nr:hypothetical protein [Cohnella kolymensis]
MYQVIKEIGGGPVSNNGGAVTVRAGAAEGFLVLIIIPNEFPVK